MAAPSLASIVELVEFICFFKLGQVIWINFSIFRSFLIRFLLFEDQLIPS